MKKKLILTPKALKPDAEKPVLKNGIVIKAHKMFVGVDRNIMEDVERRLFAKQSVESVAKYMHGRGLFRDKSVETLRKALLRYRTTDMRHDMLTQLVEANTGKATVTIKQRLMGLDEMEKLVEYQQARVDKILLWEKGLKAHQLSAVASREIALLHRMLHDLAGVQMDTGIQARAPRIIKGTIVDPASEKVLKEFSWSDEHEELLSRAKEHHLVATH